MPRGGKRNGAGRPACLNAIEQLAVGAQCEAMWSEAIRESINRQIDARMSKSDYPAQIGLLREIPISDRPSWIASSSFEYHQENIEFAVREMGGVAADEEADGPRLLSFNGVRPKGYRQTVLSKVSAWAADHFQREVSVRTVSTAWTKFRALQRRLDLEDEAEL